MLHISIRRTARVGDGEWAEIGDYGSRFVAGQFLDKLQERRYLVRMRDDSGALVGIASVQPLHLTHAGRTVTVIYAATALFANDARGQGYVQRIGFRFFMRAKGLRPWRPVYVAFATYSWRSYLSLTRNFKHYWPRREAALPEWEAGVREKLGLHLFGEQYDPGAGLVRAIERRLHPEHLAIPPQVLSDPDVGFFADRNAGYAGGDALVCLAPLSFTNWWSAAHRIARRWRRRSS